MYALGFWSCFEGKKESTWRLLLLHIVLMYRVCKIMKILSKSSTFSFCMYVFTAWQCNHKKIVSNCDEKERRNKGKKDDIVWKQRQECTYPDYILWIRRMLNVSFHSCLFVALLRVSNDYYSLLLRLIVVEPLDIFLDVPLFLSQKSQK